MRILLISHLYPNPAEQTKGSFVHDQARELQSLGCDVRVISPVTYAPPLVDRLHEQWRALDRVPQALEFEGIPVRYPRYFALPRMALFSLSGEFCYRGMRRAAEELRTEGDFDLIHAHTVMPDGFAAMRLSQVWRKPLVITVHGYDAVQLNRGRLRRRQMLRAMSAADRIVCVSGRLMRACLQHDPSPGRYLVVHNGFRPLSAGDAGGDDPGAFRLLSVGHLIPLKGHRYVLEAVAALRKELPGLRYDIVGDGSSRAELERLTHRLGLEEIVTFYGRVRREELGAHYSRCNVFVLPSAPEGFGIVYLEAMSFGKPVIACRGEGISEIIEDGRNGILVPPRDAAALVDAILGLAHDPTRAARIGSEARETALRYTWRRNAEQTVGVYRAALGATGC